MRPVGFSIATRSLMGTYGYHHLCAVALLPPTDGGWGFMHCLRDDGAHLTEVTEDVGYIQAIMETSTEMQVGLTISPAKFTKTRRGWPDEWMKHAA